MGKAKQRKRIGFNSYETSYETIRLVDMPLTLRSLKTHDLIIQDCDFRSIDPMFIERNKERFKNMAMGFCPSSLAYGRQQYLSSLLSRKDFIEKAKDTFEKQQGILFIRHDSKLSEYSNLFFVETAECERQFKFALGNFVGSVLANLVRQTAKQSSLECFPILTYAPITQIDDQRPASFFIANLTEYLNTSMSQTANDLTT